MSTRAAVLVHPVHGAEEQTWEGFSWPCFFAGGLWYLVKGMLAWAAIGLLVGIFTYGLGWFVFAFFANGQRTEWLQKQGYKPKGSVRAAASTGRSSLADELGKLEALRMSGSLSDAEFAEQKRRLLA